MNRSHSILFSVVVLGMLLTGCVWNASGNVQPSTVPVVTVSTLPTGQPTITPTPVPTDRPFFPPIGTPTPVIVTVTITATPAPTATPTPVPTATPTITATPTPTAAPTPTLTYDTLVLIADTSNRTIVTNLGVITGQFLTIQSAYDGAFYADYAPWKTGTVLMLLTDANSTFGAGHVFVLPVSGSTYVAAVTSSIMRREATDGTGLRYWFSSTNSALLKAQYDYATKNAYMLIPEFTQSYASGSTAQVGASGTGTFVARFDPVRNQFVQDDTTTTIASVGYRQPSQAGTGSTLYFPVAFTTPGGSKADGVSTSTVSLRYALNYYGGTLPTAIASPTPTPTATPTPTPTATPTSTPTPTPGPTPSAGYDSLTLVADSSNRSIVTDVGTVTGEFITIQSGNTDAFFRGNSQWQTGTTLLLADGGNSTIPAGTVFTLPISGSTWVRAITASTMSSGTASSGLTYNFGPSESAVIKAYTTTNNLYLIIPEFKQSYSFAQTTLGDGKSDAFVIRFEGATNGGLTGRNQFVQDSSTTTINSIGYQSTSSSNYASATLYPATLTTSGGSQFTAINTNVLTIQYAKSFG